MKKVHESEEIAIRNTFGGCLHDIIEESPDGILYCHSCKMAITEEFKEFLNPEPLPESNTNPYFDTFI